ncbi:hypothetical protein PsorP6_005916 [Peronosclerospora sorghi]|uniref:Uncharacterized protein n=1 Tax=Peronosclerospora sorghi TaxID=230839 RepID=A0ACC0W5X0_9STRA|nr:hypothetical protein PsorP6_005916 [Peronosclerospora sorghi]
MNLAEPMEIDNVHMRQPSREDCRRKNLCFRSKKLGNRMNDCHVKSFRSRRKDGPRRVKVLVNGRERIALIDCDSNHNLIPPGIVDDPGIYHVASVESFDGHIWRNMRLRAVHATVEMDGMKFDSIALTEYRLPVTLDLILGNPWLKRFNPVTDWQTHSITVSATTVFDTMDDHAEDGDLPCDGNLDII